MTLNKSDTVKVAALLRLKHKRAGKCCGLDDCALGCEDEEPYCYKAIEGDPSFPAYAHRFLNKHGIPPETSDVSLLVKQIAEKF